MDNVHDEINDLKNEVTHRSAFRIHLLLNNNKTYFLKNIDNDFYYFILREFEKLANESKLNNSPHFREEYKRLYGMLMYHLDKIL